jgi:hypothetical protein
LEDPIHPLLRKLLATDDPVEFEKIGLQLRSMLHERIEALRADAQALKNKERKAERRKRKRNGGTKP